MKKKHIVYLSIQAFIAAAAISGLAAGNAIAASYDGALDAYFGRVGAEVTIGDYQCEHESKEAVLEDYRENFNYSVAKEGSILLKNGPNGLPLARKSKVSIFGSSSVYWMEREKISTSKNVSFMNAMREAFDINNELRKLYITSPHSNWGVGDNKGDGSAAGSWEIDEIPQSDYGEEIKETYKDYGDAAIVVISRSSGEGADLPRNMNRFGGDANHHYLQLSEEEKGLFEMIKEAGCFKKTIVLLHANNPFQMDFLRDYDIDAVVAIGGAGEGEAANRAIIELLVGEANFSGRTLDTYCYDNLSSPAMRNFGDFRYVDGDNELTGYSYVNLAEGIYVGYKYYETRYVDKQRNAADVGDFSYDEVVAYPFGYGLSYTEFSLGEINGNYYADKDEFAISFDVSNAGSMAGKEVAEVYVELPYTDYDREHGVEKSAVSLVGYDKTKSLEPGESERLTVRIDRGSLASFDAKGSGSYILEKGDYRFTVAKDAHDAANNFLEGKRIYTYHLSENDFSTYRVSSAGQEIKAHFDSCALEDASYLSRASWKSLEEGKLTYASGSKGGVSNTTDAAKTVLTHEVSLVNAEALKANGWESSGNPKGKDDYEDVVFNAGNGTLWKDLIGKGYGDELWGKLLDNVSLEEVYAAYKNSANGTISMPSIEKRQTFAYDGPEGVAHKTGGAEMMVAATYNREIMARYGKLNADYALLNGYSGWYSPGMNLHRTPFSGRNYEYVSEDSFLTGDFARTVVSVSREKGLIAVLKHFAMNGQETNRQANKMVATYAQEQAIRETYFRPFQMVVESGDCLGIMASMNRIGNIPARANYAMNVEVLRKEWGFKGFIITDYNNITPLDSEACLSGGITVQMSGRANPLAETESKGVRFLLRENAHYLLYSLLQTNAAAGLAEGKVGSQGVKVYVLLLIGLDAIVVIMALGGIGLSLARFKVKEAGETKALAFKRLNIATIIYLIVLVLLIVAALIIFFTWALPLLQYAFNIA